MTRALFIMLFVLAASGAGAQNKHAEIIQDRKVDILVDKYIYLNRHQITLSGWRIQIFFDSGANSKRKASEVLRLFNERYPESQAYLSFKEPYYRVRVGDFRTRLEAEGFLRKIHAQYPNAFATSDLINPPPIE